MADKDGNHKQKAGTSWGHYRAKLVRRGEAIVHGGPSNNTVGDLRSDYSALFWSLWELEQYVRHKRAQRLTLILDDVKKNFRGQQILVCDDTAPQRGNAEIFRDSSWPC